MNMKHAFVKGIFSMRLKLILRNYEK